MSTKTKTKTTETDRLRTIWMSTDDRETLHASADVQEVHASSIVRQIFRDYLAGKLKVTPPTPHKTSILVEDELWEAVMAKAKRDGISVRKVLAAGIARLRARR